MTIRALVVDDQALLRTGFRMILASERDIEVVGEAADGSEAIVAAATLQPDVILMDIRMPRLDGISATREILAASAGAPPKVLILTTFDLDEYVFDALRAGASGFLLKDSPAEQLILAVRTVVAGDALLAPSVTKRLIEHYVGKPGRAVLSVAILEMLTPRELEVLRLVARGHSNAELASELVVSEATVKTHVTHILDKLDVRDRVQAVVFAYESGIVQPGVG